MARNRTQKQNKVNNGKKVENVKDVGNRENTVQKRNTKNVTVKVCKIFSHTVINRKIKNI